LAALSVLALPVVDLGRWAEYGRTDFLSPRLAHHYTIAWIAVLAVCASGLFTVAAGSWSGGPAPRWSGNPVLVAAAAALGLVALATAAFMLTHTADLAREALERTGAFSTPKGHGGVGPLWPYRGSPGPALWLCLAAALVSLVPPVLLTVHALAERRRTVSRAHRQGGTHRHLTSAST